MNSVQGCLEMMFKHLTLQFWLYMLQSNIVDIYFLWISTLPEQSKHWVNGNKYYLNGNIFALVPKLFSISNSAKLKRIPKGIMGSRIPKFLILTCCRDSVFQNPVGSGSRLRWALVAGLLLLDERIVPLILTQFDLWSQLPNLTHTWPSKFHSANFNN
jgi:hypothetical protein